MFTIYNEKEHKFQLVEEPDPSLSYTYADYLQWKFEEQVELIRGKIFKMSPAPAPHPAEENIAVFALNENGKYDGAKIYAGNDRIKSCAIKGLIIKLNDDFSK